MTTCQVVGDLNAPELYIDVIWSQDYEWLSELSGKSSELFYQDTKTLVAALLKHGFSCLPLLT